MCLGRYLASYISKAWESSKETAAMPLQHVKLVANEQEREAKWPQSKQHLSGSVGIWDSPAPNITNSKAGGYTYQNSWYQLVQVPTTS